MEMFDKISDFVSKVKSKGESNNPLDVSTDHDLAIGIMNLIAIEEHLFFTGAKTNKKEYYDMINEIREMRKELLKIIIKDSEGEVWCTSKHLLSASMRMMEVGTKCQTNGNNGEAYRFFEKSYKLYTMFWGLNMNLVNIDDSKSALEEIKNEKKPEKTEIQTDKKSNISNIIDKWKSVLLEKLDCCRE